MFDFVYKFHAHGGSGQRKFEFLCKSIDTNSHYSILSKGKHGYEWLMHTFGRVYLLVLTSRSDGLPCCKERDRDKEFGHPESIKNNERLIIMFRQPFIPYPYNENMGDMFISGINYSMCKRTITTSTLTALEMLKQLHISGLCFANKTALVMCIRIRVMSSTK